MQPRNLEVGDVVQIAPEVDVQFGACLMIVTDPAPWGAQGCIFVPNVDGVGEAYYRCDFADMEYVGKATFISPDWKEE